MLATNGNQHVQNTHTHTHTHYTSFESLFLCGETLRLCQLSVLDSVVVVIVIIITIVIIIITHMSPDTASKVHFFGSHKTYQVP